MHTFSWNIRNFFIDDTLWTQHRHESKRAFPLNLSPPRSLDIMTVVEINTPTCFNYGDI